MKLTKQRLRGIIKEELSSVLSEGPAFPTFGPSAGAAGGASKTSQQRSAGPRTDEEHAQAKAQLKIDRPEMFTSEMTDRRREVNAASMSAYRQEDPGLSDDLVQGLISAQSSTAAAEWLYGPFWSEDILEFIQHVRWQHFGAIEKGASNE